MPGKRRPDSAEQYQRLGAACGERRSSSCCSRSDEATKSSSSCASRGRSGSGAWTCLPRITDTNVVSTGHATSAIAVPTMRRVVGEGELDEVRARPAGRSAAARGRRRDTASSTTAASSRGEDTETSTPHDSLNSHSFLGWLTRATTRGTPNSVLASSDTTRLTLSSPVAATTTLQRLDAGLHERLELAGVGEQPLGRPAPMRPSWPAARAR